MIVDIHDAVRQVVYAAERFDELGYPSHGTDLRDVAALLNRLALELDDPIVFVGFTDPDEEGGHPGPAPEWRVRPDIDYPRSAEELAPPVLRSRRRRRPWFVR